jgi:hypothetical protein
MAFKKSPPPPVAELQNLLNGVAKNVVEKLYGPKGPVWGTRFSDLEEAAVQAGEALSRQILDQALQRQSAEAAPVEDQVCPECRGPLKEGEPFPRVVQTRVGATEWTEPCTTCRRCRRDFFPSVEATGN